MFFLSSLVVIGFKKCIIMCFDFSCFFLLFYFTSLCGLEAAAAFFSAFFRGSFMNCATDRSGVLRSHKDSFKLQIMDNFFF